MESKQYNVPELIVGGIAADDRGMLRFINGFDFVECGIRRFYQVENHEADFIRAWHGHHNEAKYVYVASGAAVVGCFPMNQQSWNPSDIDSHRFVLTGTTPKLLFIPKGWYNGFKTLTPDTKTFFFSTTTLEESKGDDFRLEHDYLPDFWKVEYR